MKKILLALLLVALAAHAKKVGVRPYEMDWANRFQDDHTPIVDFEDQKPWTIELTNSIATCEISREQQLFGNYVLKLKYRGTDEKDCSIIMRPPQPVPIPQGVDMLACWIYGNNWMWISDKSTPRVTFVFLFKTSDGKEHDIFLRVCDWCEWFKSIRKLTPQQQAILNTPGTCFTGIKILNGTNKQDRLLYFDSITLFKDELKPLTFQPRPKRGIDMFPGQSSAANTGPGKLPFPTREDTILPDSAAPGSTNAIEQRNNNFILSYKGNDGNLTITYTPKTGLWTDITANWNGQTITPLHGGGAQFTDKNGHNRGVPAEKTIHKSTKIDGQRIVTNWTYQLENDSLDVQYAFQLKGKTLIIDTISIGGKVGAVVYGRAHGFVNPRRIFIPYYAYTPGRPAVILSGTTDKPLFFSAHTDWYRSNSSTPWSDANVTTLPVTASANGGVQYIPNTAGKYNDCFERFFVTIAPTFEENLPNIPNPKSPYKHITGTRLWRVHFAGNLEKDKLWWAELRRYGIKNLIVNGHEVGWRDAGESFTFRTKAAPKRGGDKAMNDFTRFMQDKLGFIYGPYNNFTDFAPVNEYWNLDLISRRPDNQLQPAWARCYGPKPQYAVEYCQKLPPIIQKKFNFGTAYCDVHTSATPWARTDFDFRVPGAATFAATYYAYGEIMLLQKNTWKGPVYSEGPHFCFYSGLTDGNYAQDRSYDLVEGPWLVDFDLRKIHEQECNFGMGDIGMYMKKSMGFGVKNDRKSTDARVDRFLAATAAFGHPGNLVEHGGMRNRIKAYFLLQQLQSLYTQASVASIQYADKDGKLHNTSTALANDCFRRSQLVVRYNDGTTVVANGSMTDDFIIDIDGRQLNLPPSSFAGWGKNAKGQPVYVYTGKHQGARVDYATTPDYAYLDARDEGFTYMDLLAASGSATVVYEGDTTAELIPYAGTECGFKVRILSARALDKEGKDIGPATVRTSRGYSYVLPVKKAFSYRITYDKAPAPQTLSSKSPFVQPGARVIITSTSGKTFTETIPADAKIGQRFWFNLDNAWIDFTVRPNVDIVATYDDDIATFAFENRLPTAQSFDVSFNGITKTVNVDTDKSAKVTFPLKPDTKPGERILNLKLSNDDFSETRPFTFTTKLEHVTYDSDFLATMQPGKTLRGQAPAHGMGHTGASAEITEDLDCGKIVKKGIFMHPPWTNNLCGNSFADFTVALPEKYPLTFSASVGKRNRSHLGDGIVFFVEVIDVAGSIKRIATQHVAKHEWKPISADLAPWAGQTITLRIVADCGPDDNTTGDWACWGDLKLLSKEKHLIGELK